jgi:predicted transcriptional regulator
MPDTSRAVIRMTVERILAEVFPDETGAARLQQVGLFTLIWALEGNKEPVTAARIAGMTGQSPSQIHRQLQKLMALGIVERTRVLNRQGRGHAWHLSIKDTAQTRKLVRAIETAKKPQR